MTGKKLFSGRSKMFYLLISYNQAHTDNTSTYTALISINTHTPHTHTDTDTDTSHTHTHTHTYTHTTLYMHKKLLCWDQSTLLPPPPPPPTHNVAHCPADTLSVRF